MKALCYHGEKDIRYQDLPDPGLRDEDSIIIKSKVCGLCGSDLHYYRGHTYRGGTGFCIGHEAVGEVVEKGRNVKTVNIGDDVVLSAGIRMGGCGKCWACLAGTPILCGKQSWKTYGLDSRIQGCQAEGIEIIRADMNVTKVPEGLSLEQAVLLCDSIPTAWMGCKSAEVGPGKEVAVVGLGPLGLMAVESAFVMGASKVYGIDPLADRREAARELGAIALEPAEAIGVIRDATDGVMVPCVVEAAGSDVTVDMAIRLAMRGGIVSVFGVNLNEEYKFPIWYAFNHRITFRIANCFIQTFWPEIIPLMQQGLLKPERFITHRFDLKEGADAYRISAEKIGNPLKVLFRP